MDLFGRSTKVIEARIDEFLDAVSQGAIVFKQSIRYYLEGSMDYFDEQIGAIGKLESRADNLRRSIENELYAFSLIPENRGDVLGFLESMDEVIDSAKETLTQFSVEMPQILPELHREYLELAEKAADAAEHIVLAGRMFFRSPGEIKNHLHKVYFHEKEADKISLALKRHIFSLDLDLSVKMHLRYFADHVDSLADRAEAVADRLAIYAIKRTT